MVLWVRGFSHAHPVVFQFSDFQEMLTCSNRGSMDMAGTAEAGTDVLSKTCLNIEYMPARKIAEGYADVRILVELMRR